MPEKGNSALSPLLEELTALANTRGGVEAEIARTGLFGHRLKINISRRSTRIEKMWRQSVLALTSVSIAMLGLTGWATYNGIINWDAVGDVFSGSKSSSGYTEPAAPGTYLWQKVPTHVPAGPSPTPTPDCLSQGEVANDLARLQTGEEVTFTFVDGTIVSGEYSTEQHGLPIITTGNEVSLVNQSAICDVE